MNPATFDNDDAATTDEEYFAFVAWLSHQAVNEFRNARGDDTQEKTALCRYYKRGLQANLMMSELVDFWLLMPVRFWKSRDTRTSKPSD